MIIVEAPDNYRSRTPCSAKGTAEPEPSGIPFTGKNGKKGN